MTASEDITVIVISAKSFFPDVYLASSKAVIITTTKRKR